MLISQSLIKDVAQNDCATFINRKYKQNERTAPTTAMEAGLYFETLLIGSARGGAYEPKLAKSGKPYKWQEEVIDAVKNAKNTLEALNIEIEQVQPYLEKGKASGSLDAIGTINGEKAVFDVKFTGLALTSWEKDFKFGGRENFEIQATHYQHLTEGLPFYFLIFSSKGWCKVLKQDYSEEVETTAKERIWYTFDRLSELNTNPTANQCNKCPFSGNCEKQNYKPLIESL